MHGERNGAHCILWNVSTVALPRAQVFIFLVGVFLSTWLGSLLLEGGEWAIMQLPIVKQIYSASKQVSAAVSPDDADGNAFKECVLVRHPRNASFAVAFVTGSSTLNVRSPALSPLTPRHSGAVYFRLNSACCKRDRLMAVDIYR